MDYRGIMEKKMEATIWGLGFRLHVGVIQGGLYGDNGQENGSYYLGFRV